MKTKNTPKAVQNVIARITTIAIYGKKQTNSIYFMDQPFFDFNLIKYFWSVKLLILGI